MPKRRPATASSDPVEQELRIIGGRMRGRKLRYEPLTHSNDQKVTRPMKHRVREAIFNLVGPRVEGKHAWDLFAGTGALGLEAVSRGAQRATFIERHLPTAEVVQENIRTLDTQDRCQLFKTSAFLWARRDLPQAPVDLPWLVFFSPPYDFFVQQQETMLGLIAAVHKAAPSDSLLVIEADERFDFSVLPEGVKADRHGQGWDVRPYSPAVVGILPV